MNQVSPFAYQRLIQFTPAKYPNAPKGDVTGDFAESWELSPDKLTMTMKQGDVFRHEQPGPGGWGDPLERDPARVLKDVRNEFVSPGSARDDYGVVIDTATWTVDQGATKRVRREE